MTRAAQLATFLGIALTVLAAVHWYVWMRLVGETAPAPGLRRVLTSAFVVLFLTIPVAFYVARVRDLAERRLLAMPGYVWLGVVFILFMLLVSADIVRIAGAIVQRLLSDVPPDDPVRRLTVARLFAGSIAFVGGGAALAALRSGLAPVEVKEVRVRLDRLPKAMHGTTIVQLSDMHVGPTIGRDFVEDIV